MVMVASNQTKFPPLDKTLRPKGGLAAPGISSNFSRGLAVTRQRVVVNGAQNIIPVPGTELRPPRPGWCSV